MAVSVLSSSPSRIQAVLWLSALLLSGSATNPRVRILYLAGEDALGLNAATIGLIFALGNIGVLIGALTGGRLAKAIGLGQP